jgi:hypothetical protein
MRYSDDEWADEPSKPVDENRCSLTPGVRRLALQGNAPVRAILTGHRDRQVGGVWSHKMRAHIPHESEEWERRGIKIQEVDVRVENYYGQPERLEIRVDGETIREDGSEVFTYTVDSLVKIAQVEVRLEFKPREMLRPSAKLDPEDPKSVRQHERARKLRRKLRFVQQAYRASGLLWVLLTERELHEMGDPDIIDDIISNGGREIDRADLGRLCSTLNLAPGRRLPLGRCEELIRASDFPRGAILARIPERVLSVNLLEAITSDSPIALENFTHA